MQVFILGMHRSGTSALARLLNLMGLYFGGENVSTGRNSENEKGFWERRDVRQLNDAILFATATDWDAVSKLDVDGLSESDRAGYTSAAADIVMNLDAHRPWFVKEPRLCLLFPIWRAALETPLCIHIHRNPLEVAQSLQKRNNIPIPVGLALWETYNIRALQASQGLPRHILAYEQLLREPIPALESTHAFLTRHANYGLRLPGSLELSAFLNPDLQRQRATEERFSEAATNSQIALYEFLTGASTTMPPDEPPPDCLKTLVEYEATVDFADRRRRAQLGEEQRSADNLALQLAIKNVEAKHFRESRDDAVVRNNAFERKVEKLQDVRRELSVKLAVSEQHVKTLHKERQATQARFSAERDALRRDNASIRERLSAEVDQRRRVEQERDEAKRVNARLERERKEIEAQRKEIEAQRNALRDYKQNVAIATSENRAEVTRALRQWAAEIAHHQVQIVELDDFNNQLTSCIVDWLGSRRWRLGDALLTLMRRLLFQRTRKTALDLLHEAAGAHEARLAIGHQTATSHVRLLDGLPSDTAAAAKIDDQMILADSTRATALNRMLVERSIALAKNTVAVAERRRFAAEQIALVNVLLRSRRWRLGHLLLSLPRLAIGRGRPKTIAEAMSTLIREYERDADAVAVAPPPATPDEPQVVEQSSASAFDDPAPTPPTVASVQAPGAPLFPPAVTGDVDVVVCVHNALEHVQQCLSSVLTRTTVDYRLIVVNDGSDATTTEWLREFAANQADVQLIETNGPLGYTCAANQGLCASTATNIVLLNSDTIVPRLWLEEMLECMASDDSVGIVGPLSNAASWQSVPERVGPDGRWAVNDLPAGYNVDEFAELVWLVSNRQFPRADFINGFCFMINRRVIEHVGYLDEENFPRGYGEENDYCLRAKDAGFELAIADHCFVYHAKSKSFGDAARTRLANAGGEALQRKHGAARVEQGTERLKTSPVLADIRDKVNFHLRGETAQGPASQPPDHSPTGNHILFVLPVRGGSGGANSVVQEVVGMRSLGVDAKVATHAKYQDALSRFYPEFLEGGDHFLFYRSDSDLMVHAAPFQVIVATLWSTPALIAPIAVQWTDKLYVYYVQDYEPWFFPADDASRQIALDSYTVVPNMVLMAKTDWICRTVLKHHGRHVYRVAASLDHDVYYPNAIAKSDDDPVCIAAMIRPTTPRRGPLRTIRVLKDVSAALGDGVRMLLFGCEPQDLKTYIERNAPELSLDARFENRGVLSRIEVAELLREADIFVDLSDYQAFGRTGLEAMACGCAVVLPSDGGVYEYAEHRRNCLVVDTTSAANMTKAIRAFATDAPLRATIAKQALATAARFSTLRASLSELSVFRGALASTQSKCLVTPAGHLRGKGPVSVQTPYRPLPSQPPTVASKSRFLEACLTKTKTTLLVEKRWRYLRYLHLREALTLVQHDIDNVLAIGVGKALAELALAVEFPNIDFYLTDIQSATTPNWNFVQHAVEEWHLDNVHFSTLDVTVSSTICADLVCSTEVLEHIEYPEEAAKNMHLAARKYVYCLVPFADSDYNANPGRRQRVLERHGHFVCGFDRAKLTQLFPDPIEIRGCYWLNHGQEFRSNLDKLDREAIRANSESLGLQAARDVILGMIPTLQSEAAGIWILARTSRIAP